MNFPVENYLCRVVPSEMPSGYEIEALKAQAVCARSYAYRQMAEYGYPEYEAHVDDSTNYQVYGNSAPADSADLAVQETAGQVVRLDGEIVTTYYYSTSCGKTTSMKAWGNEENDGNRYLQSVEVKDENGDYERNLPWYRWEAKISGKDFIKFDWTKYRQRYWNVAEYQYFGKWTGWCSINNRGCR